MNWREEMGLYPSEDDFDSYKTRAFSYLEDVLDQLEGKELENFKQEIKDFLTNYEGKADYSK